MVSFNWTSRNPYLTSASGDCDAYLNQALIPARVGDRVPETFAYDWRVCGQQDHYDDVDRWPTSLKPETSFSRYDYSPPTYLPPESTIPGISYKAQFQGYDQWLYLEHYWPTTEQYAQPHGSTTLNCDYPSANTTTPEAPEFIPAHSNSKPLPLLRDFK